MPPCFSIMSQVLDPEGCALVCTKVAKRNNNKKTVQWAQSAGLAQFCLHARQFVLAWFLGLCVCVCGIGGLVVKGWFPIYHLPGEATNLWEADSEARCFAKAAPMLVVSDGLVVALPNGR